VSATASIREREPELRAIAAEPAPAAPVAAFLEPADALLREPDPGQTPFAVDGLLVASALGALQGSYKVGKTWLLLDLARAIVTGAPAIGRFAVPEPGPVILVLEESGRAALHRRLDRLARGYRLAPERLAGLHVAANRRVRLDDPEWQERLLAAARAIRPRAIFLDPLVRLKGTGVDENVQGDLAPVFDYLGHLRDETGAAVLFTHHVGHGDKTRMRGSSDLEAVWESKITLSRDKSGVCTVSAEHREAEGTAELRYRLDWHEQSATLRLAPLDGNSDADRSGDLLEHVAANPGQSVDEIAAAVHQRRQEVKRRLGEHEGRATEHGTLTRHRVPFADSAGRPRTRDGWTLEPWAAETLGTPSGLRDGVPPPYPVPTSGRDGTVEDA